MFPHIEGLIAAPFILLSKEAESIFGVLLPITVPAYAACLNRKESST